MSDGRTWFGRRKGSRGSRGSKGKSWTGHGSVACEVSRRFWRPALFVVTLGKLGSAFGVCSRSTSDRHSTRPQSRAPQRHPQLWLLLMSMKLLQLEVLLFLLLLHSEVIVLEGSAESFDW